MKLSLNELREIIGTYVDSNKIASATFNATYDNIASLVDKIGKVFTLDTSYTDKLYMLDGESLEFGKTVEEWNMDLTLPQAYDPTGANNMAPHDPTFRPNSYSYRLGRQVIPTTERAYNLERAVNNGAQLSALTAMILKRLYDSEATYKYNVKKELLGKYIQACTTAMTATTVWANSTNYNINQVLKKSSSDNTRAVVVKSITSGMALTYATALEGGYIVELDLVSTIAKPVDTVSAEAFITQVKKDVESASFISEGHSLNGNTLGATEGLLLFVKKGIMPVVEVEAMAGAFHDNRLAMPATVIVVDDFGGASDTFALLMDSRGARLFNDYRAVRTDQNGKGDFINYYLHVDNTAHYSRNTFIKVYNAQ